MNRQLGIIHLALLLQCGLSIIFNPKRSELESVEYDLKLKECVAEKHANTTAENIKLKWDLEAVDKAITWLLDASASRAGIESMASIVGQEFFLARLAESSLTLHDKLLQKAVHHYRIDQSTALTCLRWAYGSQLHSLIAEISQEDIEDATVNVIIILREIEDAVSRTLESMVTCENYTADLLRSVEEMRKVFTAKCYHRNMIMKLKMAAKNKTSSRRRSEVEVVGCLALTVAESVKGTWENVSRFLRRSEDLITAYAKFIDTIGWKIPYRRRTENGCERVSFRIHIQAAEALSMTLEAINRAVVGVVSTVVVESAANLDRGRLQPPRNIEESLSEKMDELLKYFDYYTNLSVQTLRNMRAEILGALKTTENLMAFQKEASVFYARSQSAMHLQHPLRSFAL